MNNDTGKENILLCQKILLMKEWKVVVSSLHQAVHWLIHCLCRFSVKCWSCRVLSSPGSCLEGQQLTISLWWVCWWSSGELTEGCLLPTPALMCVFVALSDIPGMTLDQFGDYYEVVWLYNSWNGLWKQCLFVCIVVVAASCKVFPCEVTYFPWTSVPLRKSSWNLFSGMLLCIFVLAPGCLKYHQVMNNSYR